MSKAVLKYVRVSPTKARLIAREVQGMNAELALASLEFMPNKAAGIISKVIASAVANGDYEPEEVTIVSCRVDKAAVMKRWRPRARGTATRILKPTSHIYVEVSEEGKKVQEQKSAPVKKTPGKKKTPIAETPAETGAKEAARAAAESVEKKDDLTKIKGIGKAYQEKLNNEGIFTYEEVANMTDGQIAVMEEKYKFKGDFRESVADAKNIVNGKEA
jgi:large subunit ribosomal protein L22